MDTAAKNSTGVVDDIRYAKQRYKLAIDSLGRSYRNTPGTATALKHRSRYEKYFDEAEAIMDAAIAKAEGRT